MNSSWIEEAHVDSLELYGDEVSAFRKILHFLRSYYEIEEEELQKNTLSDQLASRAVFRDKTISF